MVRVFCLAALLAAPAPAFAQPPLDAVQQGYRLIYSGNKAAASRHFDDLLKARPNELPERYGWLLAERGRLSDAARRPAFEKALDTFIKDADRRHGRNSRDDEALFYLANGHLMRAQYRVDYDRGLFGAARDGADAKGYAEKYLKKHPGSGDMLFVLGIYNYYVDIAPAFVSFLRFLLFLPGGDRAGGLRQLERAAADGHLFGPLARTFLIEIYSRYEGRATDAIAAAETLHRQFPENDETAFRLAGIHAGPLVEDRARAAQVYEEIIARRRADTTEEGASSRYNAILSMAALRVDGWRIDDAIAILTPTIDSAVTTPDWVLPTFLTRRANYRALLNDPGGEEDARRVLNDPKMAAWHGGAHEVLGLIAQRRSSGDGVIYTALLPGNRLTVEGRFDEAARAYEPVRAAHPQHPFVRYRLAYLDFARGRVDAALAAFTALAGSGKATPAAIRAQSQLHVARIYDLSGRRDDAKKAYKKVVDDYAGERAVAAARVGLITPYRRPTVITSR